MSSIFNIDSKFYHIMGKIADCMILSILWTVFSLPIITAGASTSALYYTAVKVLRENGGSAMKEFWKAFKSNFKQSTIAFILMFVLCVLWGSVCLYFFQQAKQEAYTMIYIVYFVVLGFLAMWLHYILSYIPRFTDSLLTILKNTLYICMADLPRSLILLTMLVVVLLVIAVFMPMSMMLLFIIPGVYMLVASLILERIYRKYRTDEEETSPMPEDE